MNFKSSDVVHAIRSRTVYNANKDGAIYQAGGSTVIDVKNVKRAEFGQNGVVVN